MKNELENTLKILKKLNEYVDDGIVSPEDLNKEYESIQALDVLDKQSNEFLMKINTMRSFVAHQESYDSIEQICYLHINLARYIWHIEEMRNITEKFIGLYREKVFWKDIE